MKAGLEAAHGSQIKRKKIEKEGAVRFGGQGNHLALLALSGVVVDPLQVGGLSAQTWTVVHQLAVDFARRKIDERHVSLGPKFRSETYSTRAEGMPAKRRRSVACLTPISDSCSIFREFRIFQVNLLLRPRLVVTLALSHIAAPLVDVRNLLCYIRAMAKARKPSSGS